MSTTATDNTGLWIGDPPIGQPYPQPGWGQPYQQPYQPMQPFPTTATPPVNLPTLIQQIIGANKTAEEKTVEERLKAIEISLITILELLGTVLEARKQQLEPTKKET